MHGARPVDRRIAQARNVVEVELPRRQPDIVDARDAYRNRAIAPVLLLHDMRIVDVKATVGTRVTQRDHTGRGILIQNAKARKIVRVAHLLEPSERSRRKRRRRLVNIQLKQRLAMVIGTLEQQPIGKCHVIGHDFILRGLLAIAEPWIDYHFELCTRRLQKLKLAQHPKLGHAGNIVTDGLGQTSPVQNMISHGILLKLINLNLSLRGGRVVAAITGEMGIGLQTRC